MKSILIVEDSASKALAIAAVIEDSKLCQVTIETVVSQNRARERLRQKNYDLLVLDLAIPIFDDASPDSNGGMSLLEEIDGTGMLNRPGFVVGLTAFEELQEKFKDQFASRLWSIEFYDAAIGVWSQRLAAKVRYLTAAVRHRYLSDVFIVTALESPELDAVLAWPIEWRNPEALDETSYVYGGRMTVLGSTVDIYAAACSRKGMVAASLLTAKAIGQFRPRLVMMSGICAGLRGKADIGDVLVADPCWNWQDGRIEPEGMRFSPHQLDIAPEIGARVNILRRDRELHRLAHEAFEGVKPDRIPKIIPGPVATGSSVIADHSVLSEIIAPQNRDFIGAEMEAYGVYAAALDAKHPKPFCVAMKSVCDFGDEQKDNTYQKYAAHMSSFISRTFVERFALGLREPT